MTVAGLIEPPIRLPVLILAGGQGNGLFPLTLARPKPAIAFGPCRLIDFTLSNCRNSGLKDCVLLTQYRRDQLAAHVRKSWNREHRCLPPSGYRRYRGTADAVYQNLMALENSQHVLILAGDHVYRMDYQKLIRRHLDTDADLTISTVEYPLSQASSFGVLEVDRYSQAMRFEEKPAAPRPLPGRPASALVSMGIYVFKVQALVGALHRHCYAETGFDFGRHIVPSMIGDGRVFAYEFSDESAGKPYYWRDVGTIDSYFHASMDLLHPTSEFNVYRESLPGNSSASPSASHAGDRCRISRTAFCEGVHVGDDVEIEDSVLMPDVRIGRGARLRRVIVDEGVQIPEGFTAGWDPEVDRLSHIISPGGIVVVSHTPKTEFLHARRERTFSPAPRESGTPLRLKREDA
jgi:glucose-1-phosphate adenylyltransferase